MSDGQAFVPDLGPLPPSPSERKRLIALRVAVAFMAIVTLLSAYMHYSRSGARNDAGGPRQYRYEKRVAPNGVVLHTIRTTPDNVSLQAIDSNVTHTPFMGVNGGFFWEGSLLSVAVMDGKPLKGEPGDYGSGWYNTGVNGHLARGTLVWDEASRRFSVQAVTHAGELAVSDKAHYWAQGGVSMKLGEASGWERAMIEEEMPAYDEPRMRTGLVYDRAQNVYMIVTPTRCTAEQFRSAIMDLYGQDDRLVDGVYLDGDGSSQLRSREAALPGDRREVYQMLALKR